MIREAIAKLVEREDLTSEEAEAVMQEIMRGEATPSQIGAFLVRIADEGGDCRGDRRLCQSDACSCHQGGD